MTEPALAAAGRRDSLAAFPAQAAFLPLCVLPFGATSGPATLSLNWNSLSTRLVEDPRVGRGSEDIYQGGAFSVWVHNYELKKEKNKAPQQTGRRGEGGRSAGGRLS